MIAVRIYKEDEMLKKLAPYGCRKLRNLDETTELWETGWGGAFTFTNERGHYDEWQYRRVLNFIAGDMPADWDTNGNGK
jgi:hypothetical protein